MSQTFIPGWQAEIEINLTDLTVVGNVIGYSDDATAVPKSVFGKKYRNTVRGQHVVTIDASGHLSAEIVPDLMAMNAIDIPVAFSIQIGTAAGATDGGTLDGTAVISNLSLNDDSEGNWSWSITMESDDEPTYTPVTP